MQDPKTCQHPVLILELEGPASTRLSPGSYYLCPRCDSMFKTNLEPEEIVVTHGRPKEESVLAGIAETPVLPELDRG